MSTINILAALEVLLRLSTQSSQLIALIKQARSENRDITDAELDTLVAGDDAAKAILDAAIADARAREGG